jgi:uncharacterized SAM-binding protein YcdF (DUF218 family)
MPSIVTDLAGFFSVPSNIIASLAIFALALMMARRPFGSIMGILALILITLAMLSPLGNMLLTPLEQQSLQPNDPKAGIEGIIVLGGSYETRMNASMSAILLQDDSDRMAALAGLARRYPEARIVFSGGVDETVPGPTEAAIGKNYLMSFGIAGDRITVEDRSLTTVESARMSAELLRPNPQSQWLLVTSAYHMPRAVGAFRRAGFEVVPFPVGWRTHGWSDFWWPAKPAVENLRRLDIAVHEWLGLFA